MHLTLKDENDPEVFELVGCKNRYVIVRTTGRATVDSEVDICANMVALSNTPRLIVSYGTITQDNRDQIPWPQR